MTFVCVLWWGVEMISPDDTFGAGVISDVIVFVVVVVVVGAGFCLGLHN